MRTQCPGFNQCGGWQILLPSLDVSGLTISKLDPHGETESSALSHLEVTRCLVRILRHKYKENKIK